MIILTHNILTIPLVLLLQCIDLYLFLTAIHFVLDRIVSVSASGPALALRRFTHFIPKRVSDWLHRLLNRSVRPWLPWAITLSAAVVLRYLLIRILLQTV